MRLVILVALSSLLSGCVLGQDDGVALHDALLLDDPYPLLIVEVHHVEGREPSQKALDALLGSLRDLTAKKQVILVGPTPIPAQGDVHTPPDLRQIHRQTAELSPTTPGVHGRDGIAFLHVLYLDGHLERDGRPAKAAGTQFDADGLLVVFPDEFRGAYRVVDGDKVPVAHDIERVVLLHELGHSLGLVDDGVPTSRPSERGGGGHSANRGSVMYPHLPVADGLLQRALPAGFDADDRADLRAYVKAHARD